LRFGQFGFAKRRGVLHPGIVVGATAGGRSFCHQLADAVLREEVSGRNTPDISSGMPVVPTERKPTLSRGDTQGRRF
jgi:hypothetical protein